MKAPMRTFLTVHEFRGVKFRVVVERDSTGKEIRVTLYSNDGAPLRKACGPLRCQGARSVRELSALLNSAAVMAEHMEQGGTVEIWT
jgi:hypothetical protein